VDVGIRAKNLSAGVEEVLDVESGVVRNDTYSVLFKLESL